VRDSQTSFAAKPGGPRSKGIGLIPAMLGVSLFILCFDNNQFWWIVGNTVANTEHPRIVSMVMFLILFGGLNVLLALSFGGRFFKATAAGLLVLSSVIGFYMSQFGVAIDTAIIRSVVETDVREASTLISAEFFLHIALYGILPAIVVALIPIKQQRWPGAIAGRAALVAASILVPVVAIYANYLEFSYYGQSNRHVRLFMNPLYPIYATVQYVGEIFATNSEMEVMLASGVTRVAHASPKKPLAVVLVLGETARADHWAFNGYERDTNRYSSRHDVINFPTVTSCGTSTADSLPCIFSPLTRDAFSHVAAAGQENLLALFRRLSIGVRWIDNSTGCKGLCVGDEFISIAGADDPELCDTHGCYDELLVSELDQMLPAVSSDMFVVLHERGSHGPTYYQNTPAAAKAFLPECTLDTFRDCDKESLTNAYDNTILYGDLVLARLIESLKAYEENYDVALLYVSDHGESLGENGLYLHGFPYVLAPDSQKQVPMLFWASEGFFDRSQLDRNCLETERARPLSHDSIFHTALGLMEVSADGYRDGLDVLATCRAPQFVSMAMTPDSAHSANTTPDFELVQHSRSSAD
jgi:lipid A ethanolaminephosphotransferase